MKFPLPAGHTFGVANPYQIQVHDGSEAVEHTLAIRDWQLRYKAEWDRDQPVTGRFDGPTQRACIAVQRARGLNYSQVLDADTWDAVFSGGAPSPELFSKTEPAPEVNAPADSPSESTESPETGLASVPATVEAVKPSTAPSGPFAAPRPRGRPPKHR